ncbi:MAG TPA: glycosyltransferase [Phycisphaerales bacterium]|nr:glycosyltransferase [Phycisphaerales bacterium]
MNRQQNTIRICFVSPKAYPIFNPQVEAVFGGAEVDLYLIATELAKDQRFEPVFVTADYGQDNIETRQSVRLIKSLDFAQNPLIGARKIWNALKQADAAIYLLKTASPGVPLVQHFCRTYRRRFVYKTASQAECDGGYTREHPVLGRLFIRSLRQAAQVIVQSRQDHDNLRRHFGIDSVIIPNGHRLSDVPAAEKKTILWVGRSAAVKGPQRFLDLAAAFPQESFVMVCPRATGDVAYDQLRQRAGQLPNLTFYDHVGFSEIEHFFAEAKVLVNTSDSEGFPNTFIQAGKAAAAILSFKVNPDDVLTRHAIGLAGDGTPDTLALNLRRLLTDDRWKEPAQNGLAYVRRRHAIETLIESYKQLFVRLTGE